MSLAGTVASNKACVFDHTDPNHGDVESPGQCGMWFWWVLNLQICTRDQDNHGATRVEFLVGESCGRSLIRECFTWLHVWPARNVFESHPESQIEVWAAVKLIVAVQ